VSAQQVGVVHECRRVRSLTLTCFRLQRVWTRPTPTRPTGGTCSGTSHSPISFQCVPPLLPLPFSS
jgi:hypothetical protein